MKTRSTLRIFQSLSLALVLALSFSSCQLVDSTYVTPTYKQMTGTWELTSAVDENGKDIYDNLTLSEDIPVYVQFDGVEGMEGTIGPLFTYIVYGDSPWVAANAKIKQAFDYAKLDPTNGSVYMGSGTVSRCTLEAKLSLKTSVSAVVDLLGFLGVKNDFLDFVDKTVVYHKFYDVKVSMIKGTGTEDAPSTMQLEFDYITKGSYNVTDSRGDKITWNGYSTDKFSKCKLTFTRKFDSVADLIYQKFKQ